jgi:hypothetical protein
MVRRRAEDGSRGSGLGGAWVLMFGRFMFSGDFARCRPLGNHRRRNCPAYHRASGCLTRCGGVPGRGRHSFLLCIFLPRIGAVYGSERMDLGRWKRDIQQPHRTLWPPRRVWHAGNASGGQHPRRSRQRSDLERQGWQFLALRRRRRGCQWKLWPTERPLGVSALYTAMDLDGRKQRAAVQLRRQHYGSLRPTGNLRHRWRCRCFEYAGRPFRSSVLD